MYVIIMGCGRVGARLAKLLVADGHEVLVLDMNASSFDRLGTDFSGATMVGNGIDLDVLIKADIERADAFAAVTQGDNRNIMAAQIATHVFRVPRVVTRIYDPIRQDTFKALGLDAVSPTVLGASILYDKLVAGADAESRGDA
ncbi:MAG: TrkA family potassium uptake protein [Chloroflexi bacterium]|nr:TrkA family potassium uptake protein [Chloroflexota bacterium]